MLKTFKRKTSIILFITTILFMIVATFFCIKSYRLNTTSANRNIIGEIVLNFDGEVKWNGEAETNIIAGEEIGRNVKYQLVEADGYEYKVVAPIYDVTLRLTRDSNEVFDITEPGSRQSVNYSGSSLTYSKGIIYYNFNDWIYNSNTGKAHRFYAIDHFFKGEYPGTLIKREENYPSSGTSLTGDMRDDWIFTYTLTVTPKNVTSRMFIEYQEDDGSLSKRLQIGTEEVAYGNRFKSVNAGNFNFEGRHFDGWYHNNDKVSSQFEANLIADMGSITVNDVENLETNDFYARYALNNYSVRFHSNDSRNLTTTQSFTYGEEKKLSAFTFNKNGYEFLGWATSENGNVVYNDAQTVKNLSQNNNAVIELYAVWQEMGSDVVFDNQGATVSGTEKVIAVFDQNLPTIIVPKKDRYVFAGYFTQPQGQGDQYYNASGKSLKICDFVNELTLYAYWIETWFIDIGEMEFETDEIGYKLISSSEELASLAYMVNCTNIDTRGQKYKLTSNIDMSASLWLPIGTGANDGENAFRGEFNGNGYVISGLTTFDYYAGEVETNYVGLFGLTQDAKIENLILSKVSVSGNNYVAAFAGAMINSKLINCQILSGQVKGKDMIGGAVGEMIEGSQTLNVVSYANVSGLSLAGGIIGMMNDSFAERNLNYGNVSSQGFAGGIIGQMSGASSIELSVNEGAISSAKLGGIVGKLGKADGNSSAVITKCANIGELISEVKMGAIVGESTNGSFILRYNSAINKASSLNIDLVGSDFEGFILASYICVENQGSNVKLAYGSETEFNKEFRYCKGINSSLPMQVGLFAVCDAIEIQTDVLSVALKDFTLKN